MKRWIFAVVVALGCKQQPDPKPELSPQPEPSPVVTPDPEPKRAGPIVLPEAIPALATGLVIVRGEPGLAGAFAAIDPISGSDAEYAALTEAVREYVDGRFGVKLEGVRQATAFALPGGAGAAVVLQGTATDAKSPVALAGDDLVVAAHGEAIIVGRRAAVEAAVSASQGTAPRLREVGSPLTQLVAGHGTDAHYVAVTSIEPLPNAIREALQGRGVEHLMLGVGPEIFAVVRGSPGKLEGLASELGVLFAGAGAALTQAQREAETIPDSVRVLGFITARHWLERLEHELAARVVDNELILRAALDADVTPLAPILLALLTAAMDTIATNRRRDRTAEARIQLARMFDAASSYFEDEHIFVEMLPDGTSRAIKRHLCPNDGHEQGAAGLTPPASVDCNEGPDAECVPAIADTPGHYDAAEWQDNTIWKAMGFDQKDAHAFHYDFKYENFPGELGGCQFTAQAFGDLDADGVFSTYERVGIADEGRVEEPGPLLVDRALE